MSKICVRFVSNQGAEDIYKSPETNRLFVRMPSTMKNGVVWCTGTKWTGGVEADCPLPPKTTVSVLDGEGNPLFEEDTTDDWAYFDSTPIWHKRGCFSYEATKQLAAEWREKLNLKGYEAWKEWLCSYKVKLNISEDPANWCFFETEELARTLLESAEYLGVKCRAVSYRMRHKIAGVEWTCIMLEDKDHSALDICGYSFEENS